jgi:hypothetical protein
VFDIGLRKLLATAAKKLDDFARSQRRVNGSRDKPPGRIYGALATKKRSEHFIEQLAVHDELSMSLSPIGSSTVAKPHKLPLAIGFQDTSRIRGPSAARAGLASSVAPPAADSARRN